MDWSNILIIYLDYRKFMEIEKIEVPESLNGIDDIKNLLFKVVAKVNEIVELAQERNQN